MKIYFGYHYKKWESYHNSGEFRNIDKRKTNVKTELLIEKGGGGYENFHLH